MSVSGGLGPRRTRRRVGEKRRMDVKIFLVDVDDKTSVKTEEGGQGRHE